MTPTRMVVLTAIAQFTADFQVPPTIRDLAKITGWSFSTVHAKITALVRDEYLTRQPMQTRTYVLTNKGRTLTGDIRPRICRVRVFQSGAALFAHLEGRPIP